MVLNVIIIVWQIDQQLADNVKENARRYKRIFEDAVYEMLPDYKEHEVL
jgi:DNA replication licensing factor MCM7